MPSPKSTEPAVAVAQGAPSSGPSEDLARWSKVYKRSKVPIATGAWSGVAGPLLILVGVANVQSQGLAALIWFYPGAGIYMIGPPLMAGGTVRQNKALRMLDARVGSPVLGYTTWGLVGGSSLSLIMAAATDSPGLVYAGLGLSTVAYITGSIQRGINKRAYRRVRDVSAASKPPQRESPRVTVGMVPTFGAKRPGFALVGTF